MAMSAPAGLGSGTVPTGGANGLPSPGPAADVVVVGAGVAGLTAAMAAARHGLAVTVVERLGAGGQVMSVERIANFPAFPQGIAGYELGPALQEQAEAAGAQFVFANVTALAAGGAGEAGHDDDDRAKVPAPWWLPLEDGGVLQARAVIIAAGSRRRALGVPGEAEYEGRGVSHCAACDGPLLRGAPAVVVGGGDAAAEEALALAAHGAPVTIVHRGGMLRAQRALVERLEAASAITLRWHTQVAAIEGDAGGVTGVRVRAADGSESTLAARAVFPCIGLVPNTAWLDGVLALDGDGRIATDPALRTSLPGVFAAGDIRSGAVAWLAAAAGEGATAALGVVRHLRG